MSQDALGRRALARLITGIENGDPHAQAQLKAMYAHSGRAHIVGMTGAPGSGKSTLVAALAQQARAQQRRVAILSVDPSSPFSGGAILGDRIRMRALAGDDGVYIRSMASRGATGGLAAAAADVAAVLDAAGFDLIFVETVGAGQADIDVARVADTVVVVEAPGMGDDVQAIKAGILEIADILVVNKADHSGVESTVAALKAALELGEATSGHHGLSVPGRVQVDGASVGWRIPIIKTIATSGDNIAAVLAAIDAHQNAISTSGAGLQRRNKRVEQDVLARLRDLALQHVLHVLPQDRLNHVLDACAARQITPADAAQALLDAVP